MTRYPLSYALLSLCALGTLAACEGTDEVPPEDVRQDQDIPPELTRVTTQLVADTISSGGSTEVVCTGLDQYGDPIATNVPLVVDVLDAANNHPAGIEVDGYTIHATQAGVVRVRCRYPGTPPINDTSPVRLTVLPGQPTSLETLVVRTNISAGDQIGVACSLLDENGNNASAPTTIEVSPPDGVTVTAGKNVTFTQSGTYEVWCALADGDLDGQKVTIQVSPGPLATLETSISPQRISPTEPVTVTCDAKDAYGNAVAAQRTITLPVQGIEGLDSDRMRVTGTKVGTYPVTCAPRESWVSAHATTAHLEIVAGEAAELSVAMSPDRNVFGLPARPLITPRVLDAWGNELTDITGAQVETYFNNQLRATLNPAQRALLDEEGAWTLTARYQDLSASRTVMVDASAPSIVINEPARAAMVVSPTGQVTLQGEVRDISGGLREVLINGVPQPITPGQNVFTFSQPLYATHGLNFVEIEAVDVQEQRVNLIQGFLAAPSYKASTATFLDGIIAHFSRDFIDDNNREGRLDDLATIFERVVGNLRVSDYIPSPAVSYAGYDVYLRNLRYDPPKIWLTPSLNRLQLKARISNLKMDIHADGFIDANGSVTASAIDIQMDLTISVVNGQPRVVTNAADVEISGLDINVHWSINWIIDMFTGTIRDNISSSFTSVLRNQVGPVLQNALAGFAIDSTFEIPPFVDGMQPLNLRIQGKPQTVHLHENGLDLDLASQVTTSARIPWPTEGSIARAGCFGRDGGRPTWSNDKLTAALSVDALNQVLHALWRGGLLELTLGPDAIGGGDLGGANISDLNLKLSAKLPPVLNDCVNSELTLQLGEIDLDVSLKLNNLPLRVKLVLFGEIQAQVVAEGNEVSLSLLEFDPDDLVIDIIDIESDLFGNDYDSEVGLIELLKTQLLGSALDGLFNGPLFSFPLPSIDLGSIDPSLSGQSISIRNMSVERKRGFIMIKGEP